MPGDKSGHGSMSDWPSDEDRGSKKNLFKPLSRDRRVEDGWGLEGMNISSNLIGIAWEQASKLTFLNLIVVRTWRNSWIG